MVAAVAGCVLGGIGGRQTLSCRSLAAGRAGEERPMHAVERRPDFFRPHPPEARHTDNYRGKPAAAPVLISPMFPAMLGGSSQGPSQALASFFITSSANPPARRLIIRPAMDENPIQGAFQLDTAIIEGKWTLDQPAGIPITP